MASPNLPLRKAQGFRPDKRLVAALVVVVVLVVAFCVWFFGLRGYFAARDADPVYVAPVSSITGGMSASDPRYSGLVEPQKITKINKDDSRTVSEVLVQEGDTVSVGQALFSYDTGEVDLSIRQAELELEGIANQITTLQDQKTQLEKEQKDASKDDQFKYTVEIQSVELQIRTQEHERSVKQTELEKLQSSLENNQVFSEVDGTVQEINLTPATDAQGNQLPFMSILSSGEFRIKGTVTEMNIGSLSEGLPVTVVSRVDPTMTWPGTVESIDYEPVQDNNNYYYGGSTGEQASKYNFYVALSSLDGLILGQHVYIEPDTGTSTGRTGLWLPEMYVVFEGEGEGYVWARDEDENLEIRQVSIGQHDEGEGLYEILSGLTTSDYIAIPADGLIVGGPTTTDASASAGMGGEMGGTGDTGEVDPGVDPGVEGGVDPGIEGGVDPGVDGGDGEFLIPETDETLPEDGGIMPRSAEGAVDDAGGEVLG